MRHKRALEKHCQIVKIFQQFKPTGSRQDSSEGNENKGFAHVVNGAKKGVVAREGSGGSGGAIPATDADNLNWSLDSDLHSSFVRVKLVLQDITRIPRNHLR
jgi:hypothetical protein